MAKNKKRIAAETAAAGRSKRVRIDDEVTIADTDTNATTIMKIDAPIKRGRGGPKSVGDSSNGTIPAPLPALPTKTPVKSALKTSQKSPPVNRSPGRPKKAPAKKFSSVQRRSPRQSSRTACADAKKAAVDATSTKILEKKSPQRTLIKAEPIASKRGRGRLRKIPVPVEEELEIDGDTADDDSELERTDDHPSGDPYPDRQYFLMKAEPDSRIENGHDVKFSIDDLAQAKEPELWDGVRSYAARNIMRTMREGDLAFFYHSNCAVPGIVGVMKIVQEHSVDESAFNPAHPYYDEKSIREKPRWDVVAVEFVRKFEQIIPLKTLRSYAGVGGELVEMQTLKQSRLSVSVVSPKEWRFLLDLAGEDNLERVLEREAEELEMPDLGEEETDTKHVEDKELKDDDEESGASLED